MAPAVQEPMLKYHPLIIWNLTPRGRHRLVGSLTGVVASKRVTEASQGALSTNGNRAQSILVKVRLTGRLTSRAGKKGSAVRRLKWHASWVQNVVRQFGPYLLWAKEICGGLSLVREDRDGRTSSLPVVAPAA